MLPSPFTTVLSGLPAQAFDQSPPLPFTEALWESVFMIASAGTSASAGHLVATTLRILPRDARQLHPQFFEAVEGIWPPASSDIALRDSTAKSSKQNELKLPVRAVSKGSTLDLEEGLFTRCAGVVLLHPFLARFFGGLGITHSDGLLQPERALCLLHYLATGNRFAPEYDLLVPKVLCNVPLDTPVQSRVELSAFEEEEAAALLAAVIRHWDALGNTSQENLRGSFLVRPGKLSQRDGEYLLQMETRSYDVLLDRLPWGLGMVNLPWMQKTLWVEWRF